MNDNTSNSSLTPSRYKYNKNILKKIKVALQTKPPMTRRMLAYEIGFGDRTYCVTQYVSDLLKQNYVHTVGRMVCKRSGRFAQAITANPTYLKDS